MTWGSDRPPSAMRERHRNARRRPMAEPGATSQADREAIVGRTALAVSPIGR
jgi:hypothetical protein